MLLEEDAWFEWDAANCWQVNPKGQRWQSGLDIPKIATIKPQDTKLKEQIEITKKAYCEIGSIFNQHWLKTIKGWIFLSKTDYKLSWKTTTTRLLLQASMNCKAAAREYAFVFNIGQYFLLTSPLPKVTTVITVLVKLSVITVAYVNCYLLTFFK